MALTAANLRNFTDKIGAAYLALLGTVGSGLGSGDELLAIGSDWGFSRALRDLQALVLATEDWSVINQLGQVTNDGATRGGWRTLVASYMTPILAKLEATAAASGVIGANGIDTFATYYNTSAGGPYMALLSPEFATVSLLVNRVPLTPTNVFSPAIANMAQRSVGFSFIAGTNADSANYAGVVLPVAIVTGSTFSSAGTLTVTGTARTASGTTVAGRTWTVSISANATYTLVPSVAGDLLLSVSAIAFPASMSAGMVVIAGQRPAGR